ncbi:MAG: AAA family ATPase [Chloroflexi bacterium]|nr:AAA family ATPase [Chloroflexota bacterium]
MASQPGHTFIGRQQELAVLATALDDALAGRGQMVMLAGEPGIGKTRLAQELAGHAQDRGAQVLWGWCHEQTGAPPYWPWMQLIRAQVETTDSGQLRQDMGPGAADIAQILPELTGILEGLDQSPVLEPEQARFRLLFSMTTFLKNVSRSQPLVLVLDDLHWADQSSLLLLEFLAREIASSCTMVVGTYRDNEVTGSHPLAQTLGSLVRENNFHQVALTGLSREEVGEFVEARAGVTVSEAAVDSLHQRTEGNPLFVGEVVSSVSPEEIGQNQDWVAGIPQAVREAISRRLGRLSETCNKILRSASVIGRDFDLALLRTLSAEVPEDQFFAGIDEANNIGIVETMPAGYGGYRFSHALIRQAVYEGIAPMQRAQTHVAAAEALEELHEANLGEHAGELAYHFFQAKAISGPEKLVRYSLMAGEHSLEAYAHEEALALFQQGMAAKEGLEMDAESASLLFGLGRAQLAAFGRSQIPEALGNLDRAFDYFTASGDVERAVAVAEHPLPNIAALNTGAGKRISRALEMVPPDSLTAGRLLSLLGRIAGSQEGDYEAATSAFSRALEIARREDDPALELKTIAEESYVSMWHCRWQEILDKTPRAMVLAKTVDDPVGELLARWAAIVAEIATGGHREAARRHASEGIILAERLRDRQLLCGTLYRAALLAESEGDWQTARELADQGLELLPLDPRLLASRTLVEYRLGEFEQGATYLERSLETMRNAEPGPTFEYASIAGMIPLIGRIAGVHVHQDEAKTAAEIVLASDNAIPLVAGFVRVGLALEAVNSGDVALAAEQYTAIGSLQGTFVNSFSIFADHLLGLTARTMGNPDQAISHFEDTLEFCRAAGYKPEVAWSCFDYAETLLDLKGPSDRAKAMGLLDESLEISTELGMRPLMERVAALQTRAGSPLARTPTYPDGLTGREVEVLRLVSGGKTDREIGEELFISIKTVGNHVSNILNKTNTANRTEATSYAHTHGLVEPNSEGDG